MHIIRCVVRLRECAAASFVAAHNVAAHNVVAARSTHARARI